jgi:MFS transporter, DHA1 family, inner membrane transport protein
MSEPQKSTGIEAVESFDRTSILVLLTISLSMFAGTLNAIGFQPFLVDASSDLQVSVPAVGQAVTVTLLMSAISGLIAGPVADHFGHRRLMVSGAVILGISAIGTALAPEYTVFMLFRLLGGMSLALLTGLSLAIAGSYFSGVARRRALSVTVAAMSGTAIIGVPLLAWVGDALNWRWAFFFVGVTGMLLIPFLSTLIPVKLTGGGQFRVRQIARAYVPLIRQRSVLALYGGSFLRAIFWSGILTYFGAFLIERHGMTLQYVGWTYLVGGLGFLAGSLSAGTRIGTYDHRKVFTIVTVAGAIFFGLTYAAPVVPVASVLFLTAGGYFGAIGWVILNTMMANESQAGSGTTMSLNTAVFNLGSAAGGAVGGLVLVVGTYALLGWVLPLFALVASAIVLASRWVVDESESVIGEPRPAPETLER